MLKVELASVRGSRLDSTALGGPSMRDRSFTNWGFGTVPILRPATRGIMLVRQRGRSAMSARTLALLAAIAVAVAAAPAPATPFAYVGSQAGGSPSVKVIDTATDTVVATIPVDTAVGGVAV